LGESVTEGIIEKWLVQPGDFVNKYDALAEVSTDKVSAEIPSSYTGVMKEIIANEGEVIQVGGVICSIEEEIHHEGNKEHVEVQSIIFAVDKSSNIQQFTNSLSNKTANDNKSAHKMRYSPAVLKLAQEHNISLQDVIGTGLDGRITRKDLQKIIEQGISSTGSVQQTTKTVDEKTNESSVQQSVEHKLSAQTAQNSTIVNKTSKGDIEIPVSNIRRTIANHTLRSTQEIPHAWTMIEVDVTDLVTYRNKIKDKFKECEGYPLTYFAFFIKAVAQALKEFPILNSVWAGDKIIQKKEINISIAVATEEALFVPVIKQVDQKTINRIAQEIYEFSYKAKSNKLKLEDVQGGTFSVNNTGSFGSIQSKGIINYPQAAILQVESIVKRPVILNGGMFAARDMVNLCLSLDHRILDGLICGKFLNRVKNILEKTDYGDISVY